MAELSVNIVVIFATIGLFTGPSSQARIATPVCSLPADPGPCNALFLKFFHNVTANQCEGFTYGGCGGNSNNFPSVSACNDQCGCPDGSDPVQCLVNPCKYASCPSYPNAVCQADYCGGCNARFFLFNGDEVTDFCTVVLLLPVCPIAGQEFQECRTCPVTCEDPDLQCTDQCVEGCGCPFGQLIDESINKCVKPGQCSNFDLE